MYFSSPRVIASADRLEEPESRPRIKCALGARRSPPQPTLALRSKHSGSRRKTGGLCNARIRERRAGLLIICLREAPSRSLEAVIDNGCPPPAQNLDLCLQRAASFQEFAVNVQVCHLRRLRSRRPDVLFLFRLRFFVFVYQSVSLQSLGLSSLQSSLVARQK